MKKKISLPVMAVSAILLLGGCGTQMYDLSEDEENLVVQYSAHILAKYNIEQKDGMTAASSEETQETQKQDSQMPESQNTQSADNNMAYRRGNRTCIGSDRFLQRIQGSEYLSGGRLFCSNS